MIVRQLHPDSITPEQWNTVAQHPLQSWQWGAAREAMGTSIYRFGIYEGERLSNVFLMTTHQIPYTPFAIGYIPRSPIPHPAFLTYLQEVGKQMQIILVKFEPDQTRTAESESMIESLQAHYPFHHTTQQLFPEWTMTLDLTTSEETLLAQMKSKTRYNIRLAQRKGVTVREMSDEKGFAIFADLYFQTTKRQRYFGHNYDYHETVWKYLKDGLAHILIAWYQDQPLAAYELFRFHDTLYYPYGGSSDQHKNVMAANLIMWEAIRFGKSHGLQSFDLWGATDPSFTSTDPYAGFTRFKQGYNAQFQQMVGSYDLIIRPVAYRLYTAAYTARQWYLNRAA